ncbi:LysR family transcriptional regulator [Idiomarina seosinensis]|uniref:LysR family transcriptional regulator n=1 Tax=Idiomarina seosinensis TaxID=281739 RepID=A0A432ZGS2_9GAMM|nr:LysR family transcriptional regulator [Idiomarina seosinensis]RUO77020.1 LysR family transcriptional regulator [Idiomarina seosinensis]
MNYKHLNYFWHVAKSGHLTQTAQKLHVSQSALSSQIKQLEDWLGTPLFERRGRQLVLTQAGYLAKQHADRIFAEGENLVQQIKQGSTEQPITVRIGHASTMSRNFVETFISDLVQQQKTHYRLHSMAPDQLFNELGNHQIDVALTNSQVRGGDKQLWQSRLLARQPVSVIGRPGLSVNNMADPELREQSWVLPPENVALRSAFDMLSAEYDWRPNIVAEADDMAMLRLLARDSGALAVIPEVVVKDELRNGQLVRYLQLPNVFEDFYAITLKRPFQHPTVIKLLQEYH